MENYRLNERDQSSFFLKSSRTLYVGNLKENITDVTLYKYFREFGDIISINIKKEDYIGDRPSKVYAFIKYFDANNAIHAILKMNGVNIEGCHAYVGFAKSYPSRYVWITGINESEDSNCLLNYLADCGTIITCLIDHINKRALVYFKEIAEASAAINKIKNGYTNGLYFHGDYASTQCQIKFAEFFNKQNHKNNLSMSLDNADIQSTTTSYVNKEKSRESQYVEADNKYIASKKLTSQITCIWVNGIADSVTIEYLESYFNQFGPIHKCLFNRFNKCALLSFHEELHAQLAVTAMNGRSIEGKSVYVRLASLRCPACDVSYRNDDNVTIQQQDNTAQSSLYCAFPVDPSCKCTIDDENYPINISDPRNYKTSQHKYLNTYNNIPKYCSKTNHINSSSITIIFNEYPPERLNRPTQYADSDILSLPLPEFAKNISKELTSTSSRYLLSPSAFNNQDTYTFNVNHDEIINYGLGKTDNQNEKQDQNNNHSLKSNYKILDSAAELQNLFFEKSKRLQDVSDEHTSKQLIQSQSSPKFKDQQLSSSLSTLFTTNSSKYSLGPSASVIQSQYNCPSDTQPKTIPQNSKIPLLDSQILPSGFKLLIDQKCTSNIHGMISNIKGLYLKKKNICTISNSMHTSDVINTDFVNPMPEDADRNKTFLKIDYRFPDDYPKRWVTTSNWLTNTPNYNCYEKLDYGWLSDTSKKENYSQKKLQIKQQFLDGSVAKNSIEPVVQPIVDVKKSTNIDEQKMDNDIKEHNIANILLSLNTNYKNRIMRNETKDNINKTNCNTFSGSISNNEKSKNNKSVYNNHIIINESQSISSTRLMGCEGDSIKPNKIQGEIEKTNVNENISKHLNIEKIEEWKKPILYFNQHENKNEDCKPKTILDSKSIESKFSKCEVFEFGKEPTIIEEEKHNLNILKNHKNSRKDYKYKKNEDKYQNYSCFKFDINDDNKSKKYTKKVYGNITSSYFSTENSLKRSVSNPYENHNDSKRWKTDNKIYKNHSTKTSKHHSVFSKLSKNILNNWIPENKNMSQLYKTPNQPRIRGWLNGHSIIDIISNKPKMSITNKVKE